jgi:hypothetical protein
MPGVSHNTVNINPRMNYVITVGLFGSQKLDVSDVDVTTLRFGPDEAAPIHDLTDLITRNDHMQDANLDGFMDLMLHFSMHDTGIACGDESARLTGNMMDGRAIEGIDSIRVVGCGRKLIHETLIGRQQLQSSKTERPVGVTKIE